MKPIAIGAHFLIVVDKIYITLAIIGKKANCSLARVSFGPMPRNHPTSPTRTTTEETGSLVEYTSRSVSFLNRNPVDFIEASMVEVSWEKAGAQTAQFSGTVRLSKQYAAESVNSDGI
jgi:hypothetical protein